LKQTEIQNIVGDDNFMGLGKELTRENEVQVGIPKRNMSANNVHFALLPIIK